MGAKEALEQRAARLREEIREDKSFIRERKARLRSKAIALAELERECRERGIRLTVNDKG